MNYKYKVISCSDPGLVRTQNEDHFILPDRIGGDNDAAHIEIYGEYDGGLFGVFDGMGGYEYGAVASGIAAEVFYRDFRKAIEDDSVTKDELKELFRTASRAIIDGIPGTGMAGTTGVILYLSDDHYILQNLGDSRCYRMRGGRLKQLTKDYTLAEMRVRLGYYEKDSDQYEEDSRLLTQYIGQWDARRTCEPECMDGEVMVGDCYLLCTDGVYRECGDMEIESVIGKIGTGELTLQEGVACMTEMIMRRGAEDNLTLILIKVT